MYCPSCKVTDGCYHSDVMVDGRQVEIKRLRKELSTTISKERRENLESVLSTLENNVYF